MAEYHLHYMRELDMLADDLAGCAPSALPLGVAVGYSSQGLEALHALR